MSAILPNGWLTIVQAADVLSTAMYGGLPDLSVVTRLRKEGLDVKDGRAMDKAIAEIWKAVDKGTLRVVVVGGHPRRMLRLSPAQTKSIPLLRSARGRGFTFLRLSNPEYHDLSAWFGPKVHTAALAFRETEVKKLALKLMRARRTAQKAVGRKNLGGRPSHMTSVQPVISHLIARRKWDITMSMKALAREVNRARKWPRDISEDTITRALDLLHEQTNDRRYERVRRARC